MPIVPRVVNVELTNACNLACTFCDHPRLAQTMVISSMDSHLLEGVLDGLSCHRLHELGLVGLGEPLLDGRLAEHLEIVRSFSQRFEIVSMNTNGVAMSTDKAELICSSAVTNVTFSLNATNPQIYARLMGVEAFHKAVGGVKRFMAARSKLGSAQKVAIQIMVSDENDIAEIESMLGREILDEARLFVRKVYNKPAVEMNRPALTVHRSESARHPCWSLYSRAYVDVQGHCYPCTVGNDCYRQSSSLCLENVRTDAMFTLFNGMKLHEARRRAQMGLLPFAECGPCNVWSLLPNNFVRQKKSGYWIRRNEDIRLKDMDWQGKATVNS